ncbi:MULTISPECIES: carboxynorspermidine decarboxylase [unclassified Oleiphilus]|jgi:carboxynorspermidine decarboxylase|uniref:carboxynorspermidine decarboxylase n=2 Tax=Oleiphilus TaxID=141450 RepID=UPI0007C25FC1|nr:MULTISPECIES: carboxynorspermidine decarboxylase [unclassified Oleiphilus]KZY44718.1 carboxynorspermidine decarboxylase [Oleiphilus sp. HI0050]KZY76797.1 carboxynorspermidine decarboxylase [Oleiphilus sp. HI0068]KZY84558.1 carboxynorspermidine decarboxylase [Oleiphilus sp. HI0069]KZY87659.1 carboxynorspermidine decarboxylase [Oleiphilus sp. HI0072]KZZ10974.1 carboxynorspermidine decarboxylase [Oleiphilus sp. HI0078]KZZ33171.1 carboxynorspermidine decarboxylase [Oleiphilus sp. HI0085]
MVKAKTFEAFDPARVPSPCFVVDEVAIEKNLKILNEVQEKSGAKILLALKAFSMFSLAPLINKYLVGTCASGLHEARLGYEEFGGKDLGQEVHTFSAAYTEHDLEEIMAISKHVVFNSFGQWERFKENAKRAKQARPDLEFGLRINPLHSEGTTPIYDPCAPGSRLGIPRSAFKDCSLDGISGLHFHTLCEQGFDALDRTLAEIEKQFADILPRLEWVNFGGGHHITHPDYDVGALIERIKLFQDRYQLQVYLEPGEAIAIHTGVLVSEVLDLTYNTVDLAILDTSATCHMPDTIEMPYRADIFGAGASDEFTYNYRLGGQTCLAGDVMGDYSFQEPLSIGQRLMFDDMTHYTMVKTNTFNGIGLPAIAIWNSETDTLRIVKEFGYDDFKNRLS